MATDPSPRPKRVRRACEYCRIKRLKCTSDQWPCLNCQLYRADCIPGPDARVGHRRRRTATRRAAATNTATVSTSSHTTNDIVSTIIINNTDSAINETVVNDRNTPNSAHTAHLADTDCDDGNDQHAVPAASPTRSVRRLSLPSTSVNSLMPYQQLPPPGPSAGLGLSLDFWSFDGFLANYTPLDRTLLALDTPTADPYAASPPAATMLSPKSMASDQPSCIVSGSPQYFNRKEGDNSHFLGHTSIAAVMAVCVRELLPVNPHLKEFESLRFIVECGPTCDEISVSEPAVAVTQTNLSPTAAAECINVFYEHYYPMAPIVPRNHLNSLLNHWATHGGLGLSTLDRSIFYLVVALGASARTSWSTDASSIDTDSLYAAVWPLFSYAVAVPSPASLQVLLLHIMYNAHWSKWSIAWVISGLAVRVAQSMGLHQVPPASSGLDVAQLKLRAQLWAVTIILDAHLSMSQGRPPGCRHSETDPELFSTDRALLYVSDLDWPLSQLLAWRLSLAQVQQQLNEAVSFPGTPESYGACLEAIDMNLTKWRDHLPFEFQPEQHTVLDKGAQRRIYLLHMDYFNILRAIHWAVITSRPGTSVALCTIPRFRASESICLSACLSLVRAFNALEDDNDVGTSYRYQYDHFLSALAIICREVSRFPAKLSSRTNLEYLRTVGLHLARMTCQSPLSSSLDKLLIGMIEGAEKLVREHS